MLALEDDSALCFAIRCSRSASGPHGRRGRPGGGAGPDDAVPGPAADGALPGGPPCWQEGGRPAGRPGLWRLPAGHDAHGRPGALLSVCAVLAAMSYL